MIESQSGLIENNQYDDELFRHAGFAGLIHNLRRKMVRIREMLEERDYKDKDTIYQFANEVLGCIMRVVMFYDNGSSRIIEKKLSKRSKGTVKEELLNLSNADPHFQNEFQNEPKDKASKGIEKHTIIKNKSGDVRRPVILERNLVVPDLENNKLHDDESNINESRFKRGTTVMEPNTEGLINYGQMESQPLKGKDGIEFKVVEKENQQNKREDNVFFIAIKSFLHSLIKAKRTIVT